MAKRQSESSQPDTSDALKCPKCKKLLEKPKLLSCLHCVCSGCIKNELAYRQCVDCPLCQVTTNGSINDLPTPYYIIDDVNAVKNSAAKKSAVSVKGQGLPITALLVMVQSALAVFKAIKP